MDMETYTVKYFRDGKRISFDVTVSKLRAVCRRWLYGKLNSMAVRFPRFSDLDGYDITIYGPPIDVNKLFRFYLPA